MVIGGGRMQLNLVLFWLGWESIPFFLFLFSFLSTVVAGLESECFVSFFLSSVELTL